jgi:hydrogenase nickel incorporation protein HypA/HybF
LHELSLASAVIDTVERHADGNPVSLITMRIGTLRQVVPDSLELYIEIVGRGTVCQGTRLEVEIVPARLFCCGGEWEPPSFRCPSCGGGGAVVAGDEFMVESIEISEEAACIAHT